ncbi:hypothetical protein JCM19235_6671 [Vibrio maritimus]|uniref:Uncharacterized protein n=1 Tax=Vibrio maritimus TaxID=990268 RepID=A0A090RU80_9VIBR|nr:hypothetical protein JCM19235_6671 [Vibrio maritimus]
MATALIGVSASSYAEDKPISSSFGVTTSDNQTSALIHLA